MKLIIRKQHRVITGLLYLLLVAALVLPSAIAVRAWSGGSTVNTPICIAPNAQVDPQIISDGSGGAIITWEDQRGVSDIYARLVDSSGAVQWVDNGSAVCTAGLSQVDPRLISDGAGGAIITWSDGRNGSSNYDIYAQRVDSSGVVQWSDNGSASCTASGNQQYPQIISDGAGGAIITWQDGRNGSSNYDIYAQRVDSSGAVQWADNGSPICTAPNAQFTPQIISDGSGGAIITWYDNRNGNYDIYAQRVDSSGATQWADNGSPICTAAGNQLNPQIISDSSGGAIITWQDNRNGNYDIYAQRVNASGVVQWAENGSAVCAAAGDQQNPQLVSDGAGGAIIAWLSGSSNYDIYAQRVSGASGAVQWTGNGLPICTASGNQGSPQLISDGVGGAIITWDDNRGANLDIYAQRVSYVGATQWAENGSAICTASGNQNSPRLISDGAGGGAIFTWYDGRNGNNDIYAQGVDSSERLVTPTPTATITPTPTPTPTPAPTPTPTPAPALTCAVTNPTNNAILSALVSINGTSADDVAVLGLKVRICNSSSGLCWNGSAWKANLSLADAPAATASDGTFNSISEPWFYTTLPTWGTGSTYQVQAQATDATTTPANSSVVAFGFGVPSTPVSPSPADSSTGVSVDANLDWSDCSNTTYYQVYFGTSSNPSTLNGSPSASSLALPTLSHNTTYYWKVVARNDCGGFTSSSIWHFTTECAALGTPVSPSPADSSTGVSVDTALDWSDCANATYYQVYFGTGSNPSTLNGSPTYSDLSLSTLNYSTTYYWKVVARDSCGNFVNSSIWHFTTECGTPGTPASPSPANTSSPRVPLNTSGLQWSNCLNTLYYDVYFGTSSTPSLLNSYITSSCPIPTLTANTTYYWKVVARNSCGNFTNSSTWYFTTECAMPHAPTDSAYNGSSCASINTTLRFWGTMYGDADYYQFYLSNNSSTLKLVGSINQSQFWNGEGCDVSNLSYNTTYYWKVVANTSCGVNNSSPIWRFTTERFLAKPLTPSPVNGSTGVSVNVTLDWEDCANASSYYVYYDTSLNPYNGVVVSTNNSSCQLTSLPYGATFYWLVVSENNCSTNYSDIWRFTTVDGPKVVNIGGANASWNLNSSGVVQQAVNLASADNKITVNIPARTTALNRYGEPLDEIAMITTNVSPAPDDGRFVVAAFDFGPDGATFHPGITITLKYDPAMIPSGENEADLVIAFYNEITDKWEYINNGVVDPSANTITFTVGHFTIFTIQTPASSGSGIWVIVAIIAAAVVVLGLLAVLFYSRYRRTHVSLYYEDDEEGYNTYGGEDTSQTRPSSKDNW